MWYLAASAARNPCRRIEYCESRPLWPESLEMLHEARVEVLGNLHVLEHALQLVGVLEAASLT